MSSPISLFITATDTDAGKTYITTGITKTLVREGYATAVYKPIAAGCEFIDQQLKNEDALLLQQASNCQQSYNDINPIAFEEAIAPHIAANKHQQPINESLIIAGYEKLCGAFNLIEGAGGWRLPLGNGRYLSDIVKVMKPQVLLVVNMKLGCLNHAVLTYQSILADGLSCVGWVANNQENMPYLNENINELSELITAPHLGTVNMFDDLTPVTHALLRQLKIQ